MYHTEGIRTSENHRRPFQAGILRRRGNTPNRLAPNDDNSWWPGLQSFAGWDPADRDKRRLVGACPACGDPDSVGLDTDIPGQRLLHDVPTVPLGPAHLRQRRGGNPLPACVVVSTVDKITAFSRNGELTSFNHGPRMRCPDHGWYTHAACVVQSCSTIASTHTTPTGFRDPTPSLWIQDELHLVREDLGVFAGHYHTLLAELASGTGHEPSKVIAATATIEQYEDQLTQVYGRRPAAVPGRRSNLAAIVLHRDHGRPAAYLLRAPACRWWHGQSGPRRGDHEELIEAVHHLTDDPAPLLAALAAEGLDLTAAQARDLLFAYELALCYINAKAHGCRPGRHLPAVRGPHKRGLRPVNAVYLRVKPHLGSWPVSWRRSRATPSPRPAATEYAAMVGTSVLSHGIDLDRLNFEVLAGMPPSYAQYIQATARAGRAHVGLVVSVFDRVTAERPRCTRAFATTHGALESMVEPVR